jgi:hypothetical protein
MKHGGGCKLQSRKQNYIREHPQVKAINQIWFYIYNDFQIPTFLNTPSMTNDNLTFHMIKFFDRQHHN